MTRTNVAMLIIGGVALGFFLASYVIGKPSGVTGVAATPATPASTSSVGNVPVITIPGLGGRTPLILNYDLANTTQTAPTNP